jgi:hypothetical protein
MILLIIMYTADHNNLLLQPCFITLPAYTSRQLHACLLVSQTAPQFWMSLDTGFAAGWMEQAWTFICL